MSENKFLFAWTEPQNPMPPYVSMWIDGNGNLVVAVRERGEIPHYAGHTATCALPPAQKLELLAALKRHLEFAK